MRYVDLSGLRFGRLLVVERVAGDRPKWKCSCDCGNSTLVDPCSLKSGRTISCGCRMRETSAALIKHNTRHGQSANGGTREFHAWNHMKARCFSSTHPAYKDYGGRDITVCDRWLTFENFLADMGECPPGKSIDRYPNNDGNYEPGNCRWADPKEQSVNRRPRSVQNRNAFRITHKGKTMTIKDWSKEVGIKPQTIHARLAHGYTVAEALDTPLALR